MRFFSTLAMMSVCAFGVYAEEVSTNCEASTEACAEACEVASSDACEVSSDNAESCSSEN